MFKNVIFDFGNVLVEFSEKHITAPYISKEKADKFNAVFFDRLYWDRLDDGSLDDEQFKKLICSRLPENLHGAAAEAFDNWHMNLPYIDGMFELVSDLKAQGVKLLLLSNISVGFAEKYAENPMLKKLFGMFDGLTFSGPIHITKPSKEIFKYITEKFDVDPADCVFVDDSPKNIDGAERTGIKGLLFDGDVEKLRNELMK